MAYNYISLVNDVNRRLNEVELTSANFDAATGYQAFVKDSVNSAIRHINQEEFQWPWNYSEEVETLTAGEVRYSYPYEAKSVAVNTARIKRDDALSTDTVKLKVLSYEEWLDKYSDSEYNSSEGNRSVPTHIVRTPSRELIVYPAPDKDYDLVYDYYHTGYDLEKSTDVPNLPEPYRYVILDGSMYYAYQFRGDLSAAQLAMEKFQQGIKHLRTLHINRTDYLRDTRVHF